MNLHVTALALFTSVAFGVAASAAERTVTLKVENMTCALCAPTVKKSLSKVSGVIHVQISTEQETAMVSFDDSRADLNALTAATENAGYPSRVAP